MFEKFGELDSAEELNRTAKGFLDEGDLESLKSMGEENGIDAEDVQDYIDGMVEELANPLMAALAKLEVECKALKPVEIVRDWVEYIKSECAEHEEMQRAVRKKGRSLKECIAKLLVWSLKNMYPVDREILREAGVNQSCKLGIPGMGTAKRLIKEYYLGE